MAKPVILTVDDEPQVLSAVERDLRRKYGGEYRIVRASSGADALKTVRQLKQRGVPIALFLSDQRMPEMTGTEFLTEAIKFEPQAKKVLLTAYADTRAAMDSINVVGLDYYLMKPWDPPEMNLYPVLDGLLDDWAATVPIPFDGIRVAGTQWSGTSHTIKDFLSRNRVLYQWLDIERDAQARALVEEVQKEQPGLPVIFFPDGTVLVNPSIPDLAEKAGLHTRATQPYYDLIIIGAGPAGLSAAVYGASEGLRTCMIERHSTGGQAGMSARIENYMGFPNGLSGAELAQRATVQALRLGAEIITAREVVKIRVEDTYKIVTLDDGTELSCKGLLLATGMTVRRLEAEGVDRLTGAGIYYGAAVTEAASHRDQHVFVIGGANSAGQGAVFLARYARQVTMVIRGPRLKMGMSAYLYEQIQATPNIDVLAETEVEAVHGQDRLEAITFRKTSTGETQTLPAGAMFIFIGAMPHSELVADLVERTEKGFILTGPDLIRDGKRPPGWRLQRDPYILETSVPGMFAAGDVRFGLSKRVAAAVGDGGVAVTFIHHYLRSV